MNKSVLFTVTVISLSAFIVLRLFGAFACATMIIVLTLYMTRYREDYGYEVLIPLFIGVTSVAFDFTFNASVTAYQFSLSVIAALILVAPYLHRKFRYLRLLWIGFFNFWILYMLSQYIHYQYYNDFFSIASLNRAKYLPDVGESIIHLIDYNVLLLLLLIPLVTFVFLHDRRNY